LTPPQVAPGTALHISLDARFAATWFCLLPRDPGLTGPEDGAGGDACIALHGSSDDIGVGPQNPTAEPTRGMGSNTQLWQRAQADDPQLRGYTGHRATLDTLCGVVAGAGGLPRDTTHAGHTLWRSRRCRRLPRVQWGQTLQLRRGLR
jgi:hypothetical protein